jgi:dGTPase
MNSSIETYDRLVSYQRLKESEQRKAQSRSLDFDFLSDKGRIITSSAFRRLQTKAQVFSLEQNASVRTRLTHTMEVSIFGELIANRVFEKLGNRINPALRLPFVTTVQNACLLHDVGNPPFGHLGEYAIQHWFRVHADEIKSRWASFGVSSDLQSVHFNAFQHFDGNPQALRIVTRLQWLDNPYGLNLTCTLLASLIKYLGLEPKDERVRDKEKDDFYKKIGFFKTEHELIKRIWSDLGLQLENGMPAQRHPLAFLMEAADDVAYCLSDIEDAIEKGVVTERMFFDEFALECPQIFEMLDHSLAKRNALRPCDTQVSSSNEEGYKRCQLAYREGGCSPNSYYVTLKVELTNWLIQKAASIYSEQHDAILEGNLLKSLLESDEEASAVLEFLKSFARQHIFSSKEAVNIEVSGFHILQEILNGFNRLLTLTPDEFKSLGEQKTPTSLALEKRLYTLLSHKHFCVYRHHVKNNSQLEPVYRTHLIVDYVSGMTDSHAVKVHNVFRGISVGESL